MPIAKQSSSLADSEIKGSKVDPKKTEPTPSKENTTKKPTQKTSFLRSTLRELRDVTWPTFGYVVNWSIVVVIFTTVLSLGLGGIDHVFESSVSFLTCASPQGDGDLGNCSTDFLEDITFRN